MFALILTNSIAQLGFYIYDAVNVTTPENSTKYGPGMEPINLHDILNAVIKGIQVVKSVVLFYSLHQFQKSMRKELARETKKISDIKVSVLWATIGLIIYLAVLFTPPSLFLAWGTYSKDIQTFPILITVTIFLDSTSNGIIRIAMVLTTLLIKEEWSVANKNLMLYQERLLSQSSQQHPKLDRKIFQDLTDIYTKTGQFLAQFHVIFQRWFVLQWIIYLVKISQYCLLTFDSLTEYSNSRSHFLGQYFAYLMYYMSAFVIPYICGITINSSHKSVWKTLSQTQKTLTSYCSNDVIWIIGNMKLTSENPKYSFVPSICGLRIPLDSTGHTVTILLTLLTFVISLISKWAV